MKTKIVLLLASLLTFQMAYANGETQPQEESESGFFENAGNWISDQHGAAVEWTTDAIEAGVHVKDRVTGQESLGDPNNPLIQGYERAVDATHHVGDRVTGGSGLDGTDNPLIQGYERAVDATSGFGNQEEEIETTELTPEKQAESDRITEEAKLSEIESQTEENEALAEQLNSQNPPPPAVTALDTTKLKSFVAEAKKEYIANFPTEGVADPLAIAFPDKNNIFSTPKSLFGQCEMLLPDGDDWGDVANIVRGVNATESDVSELFKNAYAKELKYLFIDLEKVELTNQAFAKKLSDSLSEAVLLGEKIQLCTALAFMTDKVDYDKGSSSSVEGVDSVKRSFDQQIVAKKDGVETQDFPACSRAIDKYNAAFLGGEALKVGQTFQFQEASMDAQIKAQENADDITSGMQAQKDMTDEQKKITDTRAAFSGAKMAVLATALASIPSKSDLVNSCLSGMDQNGGSVDTHFENYKKTIVNAAQRAGISVSLTREPVESRPVASGERAEPGRSTYEFVHTSDRSPAAASGGTTAAVNPNPVPGEIQNLQLSNNAKSCEQAANPKRKVALVMNEVSCKQKIKKAMVKAGVDVASNLLKSKLLSDQSDMISDAMGNVKKFEDDNPTPTFEEFNAELCQADPSNPDCAGVSAVFERGREFNGNEINVSGFSRQNTSAGIVREDTGNNGIGSDSETNTRGEGITGVGTTVGAPKNSTAFTDPSPGAASMKRGGGGGGGGGGAGGGGVGKAASSGGGGGIGGGGSNRGISGRSGRRIKYSGGSGGLSFGGGGKGRARKRSGKSGNPFSKFFKNKKGSKKGGTLNFRGVASVGGKKDSLFGMITNRYNKIQDDRLIKYKADK